MRGPDTQSVLAAQLYPDAKVIARAQYISASRRTDLPRFFHRQFFNAWRAGEITYDGGYGRSYTVSLRPEHVLGYIFWSKDYSAFIRQAELTDLVRQSNAVFHYTINDFARLEPHCAPLQTRLSALYALADMAGPERVFWRFDPVLRYRTQSGQVEQTESSFFRLLPQVAKTGITRCYFSFMTLYRKTTRRAVEFLPFSEEERADIALRMSEAARDAGMVLCNCCNEDVPRLAPEIEQAHCVDDRILAATDRFGVHRRLKPAPTRDGCGCCESRDIGSYSPPCPHGCVYCYANPQTDAAG
ncbi:MAG: DUF1848 family protein [Chitinivibrionales bacterium]|nr:DUF1848 family protein [Chitinivibrionales bacterium]MBD3397202.1 DUF1848 family protein [Chitinivibrionales bacterium]